MRPQPGGHPSRAVAFAMLGAIPGLILLVATVPVDGEPELGLGVAGAVAALVGLALGAVWGWTGRLPIGVAGAALLVAALILLVFGGLPGRIVSALGLAGAAIAWALRRPAGSGSAAGRDRDLV